jgi:hypothetical protein
MNADDARRLLESYTAWLRDRTKLRVLDHGWAEVTTPFLDRHNDHLQIFVKRENGSLILTDDGYIIKDLEMSGCNLDTAKRQELLRMALNGFGVMLHGDALTVRAGEANFPQKKHALVQAMLAVNDLFYLAPPIIASLFYEDVVRWLDESEIRYSPNVKLPGKSGYDHHFDFLIPKSRTQPERIVKAINRPSREVAETFMFAWLDTREARQQDSRAYAILNDREQAVSATVIDALTRYDVKAVPWSDRNEAREELAA